MKKLCHKKNKLLKGISLVTCCMNRNKSIIKTIENWLELPVDEIIIVDWASSIPVASSLSGIAIKDSRLNIIRVDGEEHWHLTQAFNLGFWFAKYEDIIKVDADVLIDRDFFTKNTIDDTSFVRGFWNKGETHINGFFYIKQSALNLVNGFNEYIKLYGYDDEDIYRRLKLKNMTEKEVFSGTINHIPHSDVERTNMVGDSRLSHIHEVLRQNTRFLILYNEYLTTLMPVWNRNSMNAQYSIAQYGRYVHCKKLKEMMLSSIARIEQDAFYYAALRYLAWGRGSYVYEMSLEEVNDELDIMSKNLSKT